MINNLIKKYGRIANVVLKKIRTTLLSNKNDEMTVLAEVDMADAGSLTIESNEFNPTKIHNNTKKEAILKLLDNKWNTKASTNDSVLLSYVCDIS